MKPPILIAVVCALVVLAALALKARPRPDGPSPDVSASASARGGAEAPLWPLEPDTRWIYQASKPGGGAEEITVFTTEGRSGVRVVEERNGRSVDVDHIEARADGYYWAEHDSTAHPWKLLPLDFAQQKSWDPAPGARASVVGERSVTVGDRTVKAFEIKFEEQNVKRGGVYEKKMTLMFAPGIGIVGRDSIVDGRPGGERWELLRFQRAGR